MPVSLQWVRVDGLLLFLAFDLIFRIFENIIVFPCQFACYVGSRPRFLNRWKLLQCVLSRQFLLLESILKLFTHIRLLFHQHITMFYLDLTSEGLLFWGLSGVVVDSICSFREIVMLAWEHVDELALCASCGSSWWTRWQIDLNHLFGVHEAWGHIFALIIKDSVKILPQFDMFLFGRWLFLFLEHFLLKISSGLLFLPFPALFLHLL